MKKQLLVFVFLSGLAFPFSLFANDALDLPNAFMEKLVKGEIDGAADAFFGTNPLISGKQQQVDFVKMQIANGFKMFGQPSAYELVLEKAYGASLKRFVFITKHEQHPLIWEFYVYRPKDAWIASNMNFSDELDLLEGRK